MISLDLGVAALDLARELRPSLDLGERHRTLVLVNEGVVALAQCRRASVSKKNKKVKNKKNLSKCPQQ